MPGIKISLSLSLIFSIIFSGIAQNQQQQNQSQQKNVPLTFLDTLNKGREISLLSINTIKPVNTMTTAYTTPPVASTVNPVKPPSVAPAVKPPSVAPAVKPPSMAPVKPSSNVPVKKPSETKSQPSASAKKILKDGFRIQLAASGIVERARAQKKKFEEELNCVVYIDYIEPYYKVCVGDYIDRSEAEKALSTLKSKGYYDAWIIKSKVSVNE
jgi:septal ring-binding cell division protein DamX